MKRLLVFCLLSIGVAGTATAQVMRCVDATGRVSYTDAACPAETRRAEAVQGIEATERRSEPEGARRQEQLDSVERASRLQRETVEAATPPTPSAPILLDARPNDRIEAQRESDRRRAEAERARQDEWADQADRANGEGRYGYPRPQRPQDMRPRIRNCGPSGCNDTQGNHYDNAGKLDRYTRPDGRTCRPVGTTVVCN